MTSWEYLTYKDGKLYGEDGALYSAQVFQNEAEAESWLLAENLRASII